MKRLICECGNQEFKTNPAAEMVQCWNCSLRYTWNGKKWLPFRITKLSSYTECLKELKQKTFEWVDTKLRHPKREKKLKEKNHLTQRIYMAEAAKNKLPLNIKQMQEMTVRERIRYRWQTELVLLLSYGKVEFKNHDHKGKLRGKHIAKSFHSDIKRIGLKTRLIFKGDKGIVERV